MERNNKIISVVVVFVFGLMISGPLVVNPAFANHQSEDLKWQLNVISSAPACTNEHYYMVQKYSEIVGEYIGKYEINNSMYKPECFTVNKYEEKYQAPSDLDLIVLVYDNNLGEEQLHSQKMGGFYAHDGNDITTNHAVVFCGDCSTFDYSDPVWILSHELSHFALTYYGYEEQTIEKLVHVNDRQYDLCRQQESGTCAGLKEKLVSDMFSTVYSVMPIYTPALSQNAGVRNVEAEAVQEVIIDLTKIVTQWWSQGKITDSDYDQVLGLDYSNMKTDGEFKIVFADDALKTEASWQDFAEKPAHKEQVDLISKVFAPKADETEARTQVATGVKRMSSNWVNGEISDGDFKNYLENAQNKGQIKESDSNGLVHLILADNIQKITVQAPTPIKVTQSNSIDEATERNLKARIAELEGQLVLAKSGTGNSKTTQSEPETVAKSEPKTVAKSEPAPQKKTVVEPTANTPSSIDKWYNEYKDLSRTALYALYDEVYQEITSSAKNDDTRPKLEAVYRLLTE